jgi:hypothetical protein
MTQVGVKFGKFIVRYRKVLGVNMGCQGSGQGVRGQDALLAVHVACGCGALWSA